MKIKFKIEWQDGKTQEAIKDVPMKFLTDNDGQIFPQEDLQDILVCWITDEFNNYPKVMTFQMT